MAVYKVQDPAGNVREIEGPDGATDAEIIAQAQKLFAAPAAKPAPQSVPGASAGRGGVAAGVLMGLRDPIDAGAQLLSRGVDAAVGGINSLTGLNLPRPDVAGVDAMVNQANAQYDASRQLAGREGMDVARIAGNIANPANLAGGRLLVGANGVRQLAVRGAGAGAIGGALQPVIGADQQQNFAGAKALQTGVGAAGGALLTPAFTKAATGLAQTVNAVGKRFIGAPDATIQTQAAKLVDDWLAASVATEGVDMSQIPASIRANVQQQVFAALKAGRQVSPTALARAAEFEAVGIAPTQGQVTRNPMQFARERNLRGVEGVGEPLTERFTEQNNRLMQILGQRAAGALEPDEAGGALMAALREADEPAQNAVRSAYNAARNATGKDADLWQPGLAQDAQRIVENYGDRVPGAVIAKLQSYGILGNAEGRRLFNFDAADDLLKQINSLVGNDKAINAALGEMRTAVKRALSTPGGANDPYARGRALAAARFKVLDETPGLQAALNNESPDTFVRDFILSNKSETGSVRAVNNLMKVLSQDEGALTLARTQVAAHLRDVGFGTNAAGDAPFNQAAFNNALKKIGRNKLNAIFGPDEAEKLFQIGRVAAYMKAQPNESAVNNSSTASAVMNLLSGLSGRFGALPVINIARDSLRTYGNERFAAQALKGQVPQSRELPPEVTNNLMRYLAGPAAVGVGASAGALGQ